MKWLAVFLALNILVSTNGIAIYEHFCAAAEKNATEDCCKSNNTTCEMEIAFTNCCESSFVDFVKQDVESYRTSNVELDELSQQQHLLLFGIASFFELPEISVNTICLNKPPTYTLKVQSHDAAQLQVFRC
jgi:hypothetical protein